MTESAQFASRLISASAGGYAAAATNRLLETHPDTADRFGAQAFSDWQAHLKQRLDELAAALLADEEQLFVSEVAWSAAAFRARQVPDSDLRASLECLRDILGEELPAAAGERPRRYLELGLAALERASDERAPQPSPESETRRLGLVYLEAALSGDRRRAVDAILAAVDGGLAIRAAFDALVFAQQQVGEMWHAQQLGVAQEHFVTETTRSVMALLAQRAESKETNGKTVVVASAPGNYHDIGPRVVAAFFEMEGWRTVHLAEPLPAGELALGLAAFEADLLALSMSLSTQLEASIALVKKARAERPGLKILVGGRCLVQRSKKLCERIGADACGETAADAVRLGGQLVGLAPTGP
jgi:methanogenic corrinoid protein MtbC1